MKPPGRFWLLFVLPVVYFLAAYFGGTKTVELLVIVLLAQIMGLLYLQNQEN